MKLNFWFILSLVLSLTLFGCKSGEAIIDKSSGRIVVSKTMGSYIIGKTHQKDISNTKEMENAGLIFHFDNESILIYVGVNSTNFSTKKGISVGDSINKARKLYGKPLLEKMPIKSGGVIIGAWEGLFYDNLQFTQDSSSRIAWFLFGNYGIATQ